MFKECFTIYQSPSDMYKKLRKTEGKKACLIKEMLNRMKEAFKNVSKNKKSKIEENEKMINIV